MTAEFLITSLLVVIVPGPGVLFTLASGLNQGRRGAVVAAFACTVGTLPHLVGAVLGLTVLLQANAVVFALVKILGVLYLLYLAWKMLADSDPPAVNLSSSSYADHRIVSKGILVNLLNPKLSAFFFAFLPQFIPHGGENQTWFAIELSGIFVAMTFAIFSAYGLLAAALHARLVGRRAPIKIARRGFALAFAGLAVRIAMAGK